MYIYIIIIVIFIIIFIIILFIIIIKYPYVYIVLNVFYSQSHIYIYITKKSICILNFTSSWDFVIFREYWISRSRCNIWCSVRAQGWHQKT